MVGDHHRHRHVQLTAAVAPQQIQQAVILLGRQNRDTFRFGRLGQPEIHLERLGDLIGECALQPVAGSRQPRQVKNRPLHEGAAGLFGRMLVQRNDVGAGLGQKAAHRRDQAGAVRTSQQEPADILGR